MTLVPFEPQLIVPELMTFKQVYQRWIFKFRHWGDRSIKSPHFLDSCTGWTTITLWSGPKLAKSWNAKTAWYICFFSVSRNRIRSVTDDLVNYTFLFCLSLVPASFLLAHVQNAAHHRTVSPEPERRHHRIHQHLINALIHCDRFSFRPGRRPVDVKFVGHRR